MGAKPTTITGLSGTGDIMLTCFVNLSRNRMVGVRLGSGEKLENILSSMNQVVSIHVCLIIPEILPSERVTEMFILMTMCR